MNFRPSQPPQTKNQRLTAGVGAFLRQAMGLGWLVGAASSLAQAPAPPPAAPSRFDQWVQYPPKPVNPAMPSPLDSSDKKINWVRFAAPTPPTEPAQATTDTPSSTATTAAPAPTAAIPPPTATPAAPASTTATAAPPPTEPDAPVVKGFEFSGISVFSASDLTQVLMGVVGKPLDMKNLEQIVTLLDQHYASQGRLGRSEIPPQDMTDGLIQVTIREGRFARAVIEPEPHPRIPPAWQ